MGNYLTTMKIKYFTQYLKYFKTNLQCGLEMYYYFILGFNGKLFCISLSLYAMMIFDCYYVTILHCDHVYLCDESE